MLRGPGTMKRMRCVECGERITATIEQAKRHGWTLWVGGSLCKGCSEREAAKHVAGHVAVR